MKTRERVTGRVRQALADVGLDQRILIAISGGADSTCLLHVLMAVAPARVAGACFVDHGLRPESKDELAVVSALCATLHIPLYAREVDTRGIMFRDGVSMELGARQARYEALRAVAAAVGAGLIAVGHTADDQVETVLMHEFRGAGLAGLAGMRVTAKDLLRPLLSTTHAETVAYCEELGLPYVHDPSNDDTTIKRNQVRHDVIPAIEAAFPGARAAILRLAASSSRDVDFLEELARAAAKEVVRMLRHRAAIVGGSANSLRYHVLRVLAGDRQEALSQQELEDRAKELWSWSAHRMSAPARRLLYSSIRLLGLIVLPVPGRQEISGLRFDAVLRSSCR